MDSLIETIAAWPVWVWLTAYAVIGQACYIVLLCRSEGSDGMPEALVTLIWPVWLPVLLTYLAIRRLVRWVRARRDLRRSHAATAHAITEAVNAGSSGYTATGVGSLVTLSLAGVGPEFNQPRTTEKSAPYVLDTSREIRELRERVEKLEQGRAIQPEAMVPEGYVLLTSDVQWSGPERDLCASRIRIQRISEYIKYDSKPTKPV